jgi:hypothetical protein
VNDPQPTTWAEFFSDLKRIVGVATALQSIDSAAVRQALDRPAPPKPKFRDNFTALISGEFRKGLSNVPMFASFNHFLYDRFSQRSPEFQARVRALIARPTTIAKEPPAGPNPGDRQLTEQLRFVYHSPKKLETVLGWKPYFTYREAMENVAAWLRFSNLTTD